MINTEVPLISIIVPVYNVQKYLNRSILSLVNQDYENLQIILVDDGSTDKSGAMCEDWAAKDGRIQVIHKKNEGLGMARNTGMKNAKGEYYVFVDSDDYVESNMISTLWRILRRARAEVCYGGCIDVSSKGKEYGTPPNKTVYGGKGEIRDFLYNIIAEEPEVTANCFAGVSVWGNLYKADLLKRNGIEFMKEQEVLSEDVFFNIEVCGYAEKIVIAPYCLYDYCQNEDSLTKKYRTDRFEATRNMKRLLTETLTEKNFLDTEMEIRVRRNYMNNLIVCLKQEIVFRQANGWRYCRHRIKEMLVDDVTREILGKYPISRMQIKQRILFLLCRLRWIGGIYWLFRLRYRL